MTLGPTPIVEKDLARSFTNRFKEWHILVPNNRSAGWPDRGIQLNKSRIIWFELKILAERTKDVEAIRIANLDITQAAWLGKWQRAGGYCHVLVGLIEHGKPKINRYVVVTMYDWSLWIKVPHQPILLSQLSVFNTMDEVYLWFRDRYITQSPLNKALATENVTRPSNIP